MLSINLLLETLPKPWISVKLEGYLDGSPPVEHESLIYEYLTFAGVVIHSLDNCYIYFNSF